MIKSIIKRFLCLFPSGKKYFRDKELLVIKDSIRSELKNLLIEAEDKFSQKSYPHGSLSDYRDAFNKHWCSFSEYMYQYEYWKLNEQERSEYVGRMQMIAFYRMVLPSSIKNIFWQKKKFLSTFSDFIHREWIDVNTCKYEEYQRLVSSKDCIVKLGEGCCGVGIYKITPNNKEAQTSAYFEDFKKKNALVEECIEGCTELQSFHPKSLNTLRVVTILHNGEHEVLHSFFRVGVGDSVVDNAHAGGLFAQVDIETGRLLTDGISTDGAKLLKHPDSQIEFKGFVIPKWDMIKQTVLKAANSLPGLFICGWDVTVTKDGIVEIIEGNHGPDFDVMQSPLKTGYYNRINEYIKQVYHDDLVELIKIE